LKEAQCGAGLGCAASARRSLPALAAPPTPTPAAAAARSFAEASQQRFGRRGFDRVRGTNIGKPEVSLK
jgi:hypothetical protein